MKIDNIKSFRILDMYERLNRGEIINKKDFANEFDVSEKSVQRDIDDLRAYLSEAYGLMPGELSLGYFVLSPVHYTGRGSLSSKPWNKCGRFA